VCEIHALAVCFIFLSTFSLRNSTIILQTLNLNIL